MRADGRFESKGLDPITGRRKSFYSWISQADADAKAGKTPPPLVREPSLWQYFTHNYTPTVGHRSENWRQQIAWAMDRHIRPYIGDRRLSEIDRPLLQQWANALCRRVSPSSAAKVKIVLSGILRLAEVDGYIQRNPCPYVKLPPALEPEKRSLTPQDLAKLYRACGPRSRPLVVLGAFCGLRIGEACGLRRRDLSGGILHVRGQVLQLKGGARRVEQLKTPQSRRDIPIPKAMEKVLLETAGVAFLYPNEKGGYMTPNNAHRELEAAILAAGVPRVTPHELRHTFISLMELEVEAPRAIVEELAGKAKQGNSAAYLHPSAAVKLRWMERLWSLVMGCEVESRTEAV